MQIVETFNSECKSIFYFILVNLDRAETFLNISNSYQSIATVRSRSVDWVQIEHNVSRNKIQSTTSGNKRFGLW